MCLVTGSARGIGAAIARDAARQGYAVCVNFLKSEAEALALVTAIVSDGGKAVAVQADVSREKSVSELFETTDRAFGPVTALVNNAGVSSGRHRLPDFQLASFRRVIDVNLIGSFLCARAAYARMATSRGGIGGAIVNVSSIVTRTGGDRLSGYVAAKAGVEGLTRALARELAPDGIRVNAVRPGVIATDRQLQNDKDWLARATSSVPTGRLGTPEEVAAVVVWLLSDAASYVTGTIVDVSGGR